MPTVGKQKWAAFRSRVKRLWVGSPPPIVRDAEGYLEFPLGQQQRTKSQGHLLLQLEQRHSWEGGSVNSPKFGLLLWKCWWTHENSSVLWSFKMIWNTVLLCIIRKVASDQKFVWCIVFLLQRLNDKTGPVAPEKNWHLGKWRENLNWVPCWDSTSSGCNL